MIPIRRRKVRFHRDASVIERGKPLPSPFFPDLWFARSLSRIASRRVQLPETTET